MSWTNIVAGTRGRTITSPSLLAHERLLGARARCPRRLNQASDKLEAFKLDDVR